MNTNIPVVWPDRRRGREAPRVLAISHPQRSAYLCLRYNPGRSLSYIALYVVLLTEWDISCRIWVGVLGWLYWRRLAGIFWSKRHEVPLKLAKIQTRLHVRSPNWAIVGVVILSLITVRLGRRNAAVARCQVAHILILEGIFDPRRLRLH